MAKVTSVTFEALVQTRQFENKRISATAVLDPKDDPAEVRLALETFVMQQLGRGMTDAEIQAALTKAREVQKHQAALKSLKNVKAVAK